jgi:hypothetical protein
MHKTIKHYVYVPLLVLSMAVGMANAANQKLPDVEIRPHNGRPTMFIDGDPRSLPGFLYQNQQNSPFYNNPDGIRVYHLHSFLGFWIGETIHNKPQEDVTSANTLDNQAKRILKGNPDAYFFIRFYTRPPVEWRDRHPAEYSITDEGTTCGSPSMASDLYYEMATKFCTNYIRYIESRPWAKHVIGYININLEEGAHMPVAAGWLYDHNPYMVQRWRGFLEKKYKTKENLQTAYSDTTLTFRNAEVPKDKLRGPMPDVTGILYWQDRKDNQELRDYLELQSDLFHLRFRQYGEAMKAAVNRKVLLFHDALKQTMLGWNLDCFFGYSHHGPAGDFGKLLSWSPAYPELMGGSGSINVAAMFKTPGFDGIMTPHDYQARCVGGVYEPEGIVDSAILRGKYFFGEMDTRVLGGVGEVRNEREFAAVTWRNFATSFARGFESYYMLQTNEYGTLENPKILETEKYIKVMHRQVEVMKESVNWPHETKPGIAMILDDSAVLETNGAGNFFNEAIMWEQKMGLARCGVPHNIYLFEDLALDNFPQHRVYYFPNLFRVDKERMELLRKKVFRNGAIVVWGPGSGISDGVRISSESATALTGFQFDLYPLNYPRRTLISNFDHPITRDLRANMVIGGPLPYGPVLLPTDGIELGQAWAKMGPYYQVGMAIKEFGKGAALNNNGIAKRGEGDYAAVFTSSVNLPADLWRNIARYAGAHVYSESNDVLIAGGSIVAIHSLKSGKKSIVLPGKYRVHDLVTGKMYSRGTRKISFNLKAPETQVFLLE